MFWRDACVPKLMMVHGFQTFELKLTTHTHRQTWQHITTPYSQVVISLFTVAWLLTPVSILDPRMCPYSLLNYRESTLEHGTAQRMYGRP